MDEDQDQDNLITRSPEWVDKRAKGIDHVRTVALAKKGLTHGEIARLQGCDRSNISKVLQRYGVEERRVNKYKEYRADILAGLQDRLLSSIPDSDIQKSGMYTRVVSAGILYDKERLERGQATSVNINVLVDLAEAIRSLDD